MSDFKIIGNPNPVIGKEEIYSVSIPMLNALPSYSLAEAGSKPFEYPVKWEVYVLEHGKWRKTKENDKTGKKVTYTFLQGSLDRKGIRILATRGEEKARLDIKSQTAEKPKIDSVELLDKSGKKPSEPLSYGQTLKARAHCIHMERRRIYVTLWEGDDKTNEKKIIRTLPAYVKDGIADVDFLLTPSSANMGTKGKMHEYYVTTDFDNKKIVSNNVQEFEAPIAPYKAKTSPIQQPKTNTPISAKSEINSVHITDTDGHNIRGVFRAKQIKVWINSSGLIGKEISLKLYEHDNGSPNDLLMVQDFTIRSDLHAIVIPLDTIPRSLGGTYLEEGSEQELFADVEVVQTHAFTKSAILNVDAKVFKSDPIEATNSLMTIFQPSAAEKKKKEDEEKKKEEEGSCGEKFCIKKGDKSELIREINIRLAGFGGNVPTDEFTDRTEKMIKQFQKDYMKVTETGKICGNVLKAIDEFCNKWSEKISEYRCLCKDVASINNKCLGFGKGRYKDEYSSTSKIERYHKYERPGMHRSLLWGTSALRFYLNQQNVYKYLWKTAGYRCWEHNDSVPRKSTNHMGKAVDIQFSKNGVTIQGKNRSNLPLLNEINDKFYSKYLQAKYQWVNGKNNFSVEPIGISQNQTYSWIHLDVREFDNEYLDDKYFVKTQEKISNGTILELAKKLGFLNTCLCNSTGNNSDVKPKEDDRKSRVDPKTLKTSSKGKHFIKDWEEFKSKLYNDDSEDHHCTIGYGHLVHLGPCNGSESQEFKNGITKERALELFDLRLVDFEKAVQRDVTVPLYQYEFDALVSFLFNCGENFFVKKKAPKLHKHLLNKEYSESATELLDVTSGGLGGLVKRRKAENNMFLNNIYDSKH